MFLYFFRLTGTSYLREVQRHYGLATASRLRCRYRFTNASWRTVEMLLTRGISPSRAESASEPTSSTFALTLAFTRSCLCNSSTKFCMHSPLVISALAEPPADALRPDIHRRPTLALLAGNRPQQCCPLPSRHVHTKHMPAWSPLRWRLQPEVPLLSLPRLSIRSRSPLRSFDTCMNKCVHIVPG